jgi:hypothetical protein
VIQVYGSSTYDFTAALKAASTKKKKPKENGALTATTNPDRDPWVTYGIPPKLNPEFPKKGSLFLPAAVGALGSNTVAVHWPTHYSEKTGVRFPTMKVTRKQLDRHIALYGSECTGNVIVVQEKTGPQVLDLHAAGKTTAEIAAMTGKSIRTVERHLAKVG